MAFKFLMASGIAAFGVALGVGLPSPAAAQEAPYPWCTQGSAIHCYYMSLQQCEETVDYHGFCIPNPDYRPRDDHARRSRTLPQ